MTQCNRINFFSFKVNLENKAIFNTRSGITNDSSGIILEKLDNKKLRSNLIIDYSTTSYRSITNIFQ